MPSAEKEEAHDGGIWAWILGAAVAVAATLLALNPTYIFDLVSNTDSSGLKIPRVILDQGAYTGTVLPDSDLPVPIEAWLGIPYAKPPVGKLRFRRPRPIAAGRRRDDATKYGHRCPGKQLLASSNLPDESEDCLTVNLFRQINSKTKQAVMVYIHGGAFNRGYASMHDTPSMLSWSPEPFIAVSFNYRLGALGFLPSAVAAQEGILNLGLRDQILALEWVQRNIEKFGGDPGDVTVFGVSAGAHSIGHHLMNVNQKKKLFHKAVIESGGPTSRAVHRPDSALHEEQFRKLLVAVGCQDESEDRQLQCLREVPSVRITQAQADVFDEYNPSIRWAWQPSIDGDLISRRPIEALRSGDWNSVPIITGFNHNEGTYYVPKKKLNTDEDFRDFFRTLLPQLTDDDVSRLSELYPDPDKDASSPYLDTRDLDSLGISTQFKRTEAAYGQYAYVCPVRQTAHLGSAAQSEPIYLYHWAVNRTVLGGANHADQMAFETLSPSIRRVADSLDWIAESFHSYLTSFILSGDPNKIPGLLPDRPRWESFSAERGRADTMVLGAGNDEAAGGENEGVLADFVEDRWAEAQCGFWWEKSEVSED